MRYNAKMTGVGVTDNLLVQVEKEVRKWNNNQYQTRKRYVSAAERFFAQITEKYKLQKIQNIDNKHLKFYAEKLKEKNCSPKYIKTELSAIRFFHNSMDQTKNRLLDPKTQNEKILKNYKQSKDQTKIERAWTDREVVDFKNLAIGMGRQNISNFLEVARSLGTRLNETVTLKSDQIQEALQNGYIHLSNTKGGIPRDIPLTQRARVALEALDLGKKYPLVPGSDFSKKSIEAYKKSVQDYIRNNRDRVQDQNRKAEAKKGEKSNITMHGLRHARLKEYFEEQIEKGYSQSIAKKMTSELAGHHRERVTDVYITSL